MVCSSFRFLGVAVLAITIGCLPFFDAVGVSCTTAVISGRVTVDGRPLLWKNRDTSTAHNEVVQFSGGKYAAIGVVNAGSRSTVWMGVNEAGFCIENSLSRDLASSNKAKGPGNGGIIKLALETCATIDDFKQLLESTNQSGRSTVANFGVIDAEGGAAIFETGPNSFTVFDANDPATAPNGYVVRSNFAISAQSLPANPTPEQLEPISSGERFLRACSLLDQRDTKKISLNYVLRNMARDLADVSGNAIPGSINAMMATLPPMIETNETISRTTTVSAAVFHGVLPDEDPALTTMWTILGDPKFSIALPCWVAVEEIADVLTDKHGAEIGEIAITLRDWSLTHDRTGVDTHGLPGIWQDVWPIEDQIISATLKARDRWANNGVDSADISSFHATVATQAMAAMEKELQDLKHTILSTVSDETETTSTAPIRIAIYDHSDNTANGPKNLMKFLTPEIGFACERVRPAEIQEGALTGFQALIVPGGSGSLQASKLGESGRIEIRDFVKQGGGYVGICAGSYLASSQYSWSLDIIDAKVWDRAHWARGTGQVTMGLTAQGNDLFDQAQQNVIVYYGQGPLLVPGNNADLPDYEVLASYETEIASKGAPAGAMIGTHAIVRSTFGEGRVICYSPHPESSTGPNELIVKGLRWAANSP